MGEHYTCKNCGKVYAECMCDVTVAEDGMSDGKKDWAMRHCPRCEKLNEQCDCAAQTDRFAEVSNTFKQRLENIGINDAMTLVMKGKTYGDSWRKRGGGQAFAVLARKWDRIENILEPMEYDIFQAWVSNPGDIVDDIRDLRRYLMLVEEHMTK